MKFLVTGGSGYLGNHILRHFDADDFSRRSNRDLLNLYDTKAVGEYDVVIHLAAHLDKAPEAADEVFLTNVDGTVNVLKSVKEGAVFIFASTKDVYGRFADNFRLVPESCSTQYAGQTALEWSKLVAERYVEFYANQRNFRSCIFRLSTVYAPPSEGNTPGFPGHYAESIDKGESIRLPGSGSAVRDLLHVDDLSSACNAFIDSVVRHGLYNLGGGPENALSLRELVSELEKASGYQASLNEDDPLPEPVPARYVSDLSLVEQEIDWSPSVDLKEGLRTLFSRGIEYSLPE
ncbi:MAG: NAD(P)-dependent oxidoreductase [Acidobacteria bacterium]|nr:MAG: NAD(P)-dependent oxidoreductase [Acidobacteriota bacterium]REK02275.1 MAG: NAD(P)-dependent oxidoreductase [Acidobacteriota bacterium]REK13922.1 MAG: NAD(P)-dependent oxidoreductase [Acidobacteriota bacterium]REK41916.1 MAG: NAD(P)-dependent oxidoreductase [Acidobacteriota bacterium]